MNILNCIPKPCPFCGFDSDPHKEFCYETDQGTKWGRFCCERCGAKGPEVRTSYMHWNRRKKILAFNLPRKMTTWGKEAIEEWNQRALTAKPPKRVISEGLPFWDFDRLAQREQIGPEKTIRSTFKNKCTQQIVGCDTNSSSEGPENPERAEN